MLRSYLKIAYRNIMRYLAISFISLFGLAVGLSSCLLMLTCILNECNYDNSNKDAGRIYAVTDSHE